MANVSDKLATKVTDHSVELIRHSADITIEVEDMLRQLLKEMLARVGSVDLTVYSAARLRNLISDVRDMIAETYSNIDSATTGAVTDLVQTESEIIAKVIDSQVGIDLMSALVPESMLKSVASDLLIQGAPSADWWARQSDDLAFRFSNIVRLGVSASETTDQIMSRIRGADLFAGAADRGRALVQTSIQTAANGARLETFRANADVLQGVQQISTLDSHTTEICMAYDHQAWDLDGNPMEGTDLPFVNADGSPDGVPRHWNCRSVLIPITKSWKDVTGVEVDFPEDTRASMDGQVSDKLSFDDWFSSKSAAQQDDILGAGKAALMRDGKISMTDLLDQRGNPLTLEELKVRHGV